jgi:hypothetical protein
MGVPGMPPLHRIKKLHDKEWTLLKALTEITNLSRLSINVDFCYHMLDHEVLDEEIFGHEHIRAFICYMRSHMLKKGDALGTTQIHGYCRVHDEVEDKRYRFHSDDDEYGKSHLTVMKNGPHQSSTRHNHSDSGSDVDEDDGQHDWETEDEDEEDDDDEYDEYGDESDGASDISMPTLEDCTDDETMPTLENDLD